MASTAQSVSRAKLATVAKVEFPFFRLNMNQESSGMLSQTWGASPEMWRETSNKNINVWGDVGLCMGIPSWKTSTHEVCGTVQSLEQHLEEAVENFSLATL